MVEAVSRFPVTVGFLFVTAAQANALVAAGDECGFARQIEWCECHLETPCLSDGIKEEAPRLYNIDGTESADPRKTVPGSPQGSVVVEEQARHLVDICSQMNFNQKIL